LQVCGAPARNFAVLAVARAEKQKGRGRGCPGLFIGTGEGSKWQALIRIKRGRYCTEETVVGVVNARKKKLRWPDVRARAVSEGERRLRYPFGFGFLGRGPDLELGRMASPRPFLIFSFLLFPFSVS
jgi:hypothetical protein